MATYKMTLDFFGKDNVHFTHEYEVPEEIYNLIQNLKSGKKAEDKVKFADICRSAHWKMVQKSFRHLILFLPPYATQSSSPVFSKVVLRGIYTPRS